MGSPEDKVSFLAPFPTCAPQCWPRSRVRAVYKRLPHPRVCPQTGMPDRPVRYCLENTHTADGDTKAPFSEGISGQKEDSWVHRNSS